MSYVKVLLANKLIALIDSRMNKKIITTPDGGDCVHS